MRSLRSRRMSCDDLEPVRFDYDAAVALLLTIVMAAWMTRAHLVGHAAGVISGFLLASGAMSLWYVLVSIVALARRRRVSRRGEVV